MDVSAGGLVSGSPSQATVVTAVGPSTVPVGVPMSSAGLRRVGPGSPPPVIDDVAQFSFDGSATQTQTVSSTFAQPLPVTVTPTYEIDGEPTTPDELARTLSDRERRSGTLTVTYEIANVTSQTTTVSFVDPAGARRTEVVTQAVPIAGALSLTFPRNASGIDAPGATLTPGASGVGASWTVMLAPPLAPTRQSISYSVNLTNAQVPRARLSLGVVVPDSPRPARRQPRLAQQRRRPSRRRRLGSRRPRPRPRRHSNRCKRRSWRSSRPSESGRALENRASDGRSNDLVRLSDGELSDLSQTISTTATSARGELEAAVAQIRDALDGLGAEVADHSDRLMAHSGLLDLLEAATEALSANAECPRGPSIRARDGRG